VIRSLSILLTLMVLSNPACSKPEAGPSKSSYTAFTEFTKSYVAAKYPSKGELATCVSDKSCNVLYLRAMNSLDLFLKQGRGQAFIDILWIIENQCPLGRKGAHQCSAAAGLLYIFNTKEEDDKLLSFVKKSHSEIVKNLFYGKMDWLVHRPNEHSWVSFIDSSDAIDLERKGSLRGWVSNPPDNSRIINIHRQYEDWKQQIVKND